MIVSVGHTAILSFPGAFLLPLLLIGRIFRTLPLLLVDFLHAFLGFPQDAIDGTDGGERVLRADSVVVEFLAYFPREKGLMVLFIVDNLGHDKGRGDSRLGSANTSGQNRARFEVSVFKESTEFTSEFH